MEIILMILVVIMVYEIIYAIPKRQKEQRENIRLHFEELNIRLNRLEKQIKDKK